MRQDAVSSDYLEAMHIAIGNQQLTSRETRYAGWPHPAAKTLILVIALVIALAVRIPALPFHLAGADATIELQRVLR